jgi:hypothetical protein
MLGPGLVLAVLLVLCAGAEARTIYTIAGGGHLPPPRAGDPPVPATAVEFDSVGIIELDGGRLLLRGTGPNFRVGTFVLDERGWLRAVRLPRSSGKRSLIGTDRFGTEHFSFFGTPPGLELRRPGGPYVRFSGPPEFSVDQLVHPDGGVLISENQWVRRYLPDGSVRPVAGTGARGSSPDGVVATHARFRYVTDLAFGPDRALLLIDRNDHRIRRVDPHDGTLSTVVGTGEPGGSGDGGPASEARVDWPTFVKFGRYGGFALAETGFSATRVRRVSRFGTIHTVAGGTAWRAGGLGLQLLAADGGDARKGALYDISQPLLITGRDEYMIGDGELIRFVTLRRTRRLALALRTVVPERRRVSYSLSRPARLRLQVVGEGRMEVRTRSAGAGLGFFRLPAGLPAGGYRIKLTAHNDDGAVAVREAPVLTRRRLPVPLAVSALHANEAETPLFKAGGIVKRRYSLLGRATGCRRFGPRRVDCEFVDRITETCEIWAARLDRQGQIWVGFYGCSERGFQRRPQRRKGSLDRRAALDARTRPHLLAPGTQTSGGRYGPGRPGGRAGIHDASMLIALRRSRRARTLVSTGQVRLGCRSDLTPEPSERW